MRGEHHPTFRSFFSLSPLFPARSFDPSVSAFLSQLFNLKVKEAFFAKAGKRRKRYAETTESSGKCRMKLYGARSPPTRMLANRRGNGLAPQEALQFGLQAGEDEPLL